MLTGLTVNGDLNFAANFSETRIAGGTTFANAHLLGINTAIGFAPGQTLTGSVLFEGGSGGSRFLEMDGNAGTLTIGPTGVVRTVSGLGAAAFIGGSNVYGGAMTLINNGLISSQAAGRTITIQSASFTNNGTGASLGVEALNGGILTINPTGSWSNAGTIRLDANLLSTINLGGTFNTAGGIGIWNNAGGTVNIIGTVNNVGSSFTLDASTGSWTLNGGAISGGALNFANSQNLLIGPFNTNLLTGLTVNGDLSLNTNFAETRIAGGTTFANANLNGVNVAIGFAPGQTLTGSVLFGGGVGGSRFLEMDGNAGTFTIGATGVVRTVSGLGATAFIGGNNVYGGAMTLINNGLISSQVAGHTINIQSASFANNGTGASLGLEALNGGILTISPTGSWSNAGTIRLDSLSTVNLGGTFNIAGGIGIWNNAGGTVNIVGTVNDVGSAFTLDASTGSWTLNGGAISGGALNFANGQDLLIGAVSTNLLTGLTVNGDLSFAANFAETRIAGGTTFANAHLLGVNVAIGFAPGQTLTGSVLFEGGNGGSRFLEMDGNAGTFTIGATGVVRTVSGLAAGAFIGGASVYGGAMTLINNGLISSQVAGHTLTILSASFTNNGNGANLGVEALNGGTLTISPTSSWSNAGTIRLDANPLSTINLGGTLNTTGGIGTWSNAGGTVNIVGTINNVGSAFTLDASTGSWTLNGGTISGGTLNFANGQNLLIGAVSTNQLAGLTVNGDLSFAANFAESRITGGTTFANAHLLGVNVAIGFAPGQTLSSSVLFEGANGGSRFLEMDGNAGTFTIGATGVVRTVSGLGADAFIGGTSVYGGAMTLTNNGLISSQVAGHTVTIQAATFTNGGTLEAINGGSVSVPAGYTQTAGVTRVGNGSSLSAISGATTNTININGGSFEGSGTVNANVNSFARTVPGGPLATGILTVNGDLFLNGTSTTEIDLGGTTVGAQYDRIIEGGTFALTLGGSLSLKFLNGFQNSIQAGDTFTILVSNQAIAGLFSNVVGGRITDVDGFGSFSVTVVGNNVILGNFQVPEPSTICLVVLGISLLAWRRRGRVA